MWRDIDIADGDSYIDAGELYKQAEAAQEEIDDCLADAADEENTAIARQEALEAAAQLREDYHELLEFAEMCRSDGVEGQLINDKEFEQYARDYAEQMSETRIELNRWPFNCIDWSDAADELRSSFTEYRWPSPNGDTYYAEVY